MTDRPMPVAGDAATTDPDAGRYGAGRARRPVAMLLAIAINALVLLALMTLSPQLQPRKAEQRMPVSFTMADTPKPEGKVVTKAKAAAAAARVARRAATPRPVEAAPPPQTPDLPFVVLSREVLASGDIGKMARGSGDKATGPADSAAAYGPGQGPGGERLYPVEWVREPTDAELSPFMPRGVMPGAWGLVACRTAENNRVENCQMLAESPVGSGMARAVRLASWQFLIRPPRIGGKPQIGVWMSVCIDLGKERGMCSRK